MSHSPVFMLSSPTSCTKNILFFSKCLRTLGAHRQLHTQTAPARRPTPTQAERTASKPGRLQKLHRQEAAFLFRVATYRGSSHGTPRPPHGRNSISQKLALGRQLGGVISLSQELGGSKKYHKDHTETLEVTQELLRTVGDTRASFPPANHLGHSLTSAHTPGLDSPDLTKSHPLTSLTGFGAEINQSG